MRRTVQFCPGGALTQSTTILSGLRTLRATSGMVLSSKWGERRLASLHTTNQRRAVHIRQEVCGRGSVLSTMGISLPTVRSHIVRDQCVYEVGDYAITPRVMVQHQLAPAPCDGVTDKLANTVRLQLRSGGLPRRRVVCALLRKRE